MDLPLAVGGGRLPPCSVSAHQQSFVYLCLIVPKCM